MKVIIAISIIHSHQYSICNCVRYYFWLDGIIIYVIECVAQLSKDRVVAAPYESYSHDSHFWFYSKFSKAFYFAKPESNFGTLIWLSHNEHTQTRKQGIEEKNDALHYFWITGGSSPLIKYGYHSSPTSSLLSAGNSKWFLPVILGRATLLDQSSYDRRS